MGRPVDENGWLVDEELGGQKTSTSNGTGTRNNAMQTKRTRTKTLFHFDSSRHPGCTIMINNTVISGVTVTVVQDHSTVYDGTQTEPHEVKGMVRVFGQFFGWPGVASAKDLGPDHPVGVHVYAFDPMTNKNYVMEITGAYITNLVTHAFLAASWKPWRELNQPDVQVDVSVDPTPGTPNKNGDQFCTDAQDLLDKFQDYQAKGQPVDKSVPKKTDAPASRQARVLPPDAFKPSPVHVKCPKCGVMALNIMAHKCDGCWFIVRAGEIYTVDEPQYVGKVPPVVDCPVTAQAEPFKFAPDPRISPCVNCGRIPMLSHSLVDKKYVNLISGVRVMCGCGECGPKIPYNFDEPDVEVRFRQAEETAIHVWNEEWNEKMGQDKVTDNAQEAVGTQPIQYARTPPPQPCLCGCVPGVWHSVLNDVNTVSYAYVRCCDRVEQTKVPYDTNEPDAAVRAHRAEALAIHAWNKKVWKERRKSQDKTTDDTQEAVDTQPIRIAGTPTPGPCSCGQIPEIVGTTTAPNVYVYVRCGCGIVGPKVKLPPDLSVPGALYATLTAIAQAVYEWNRLVYQDKTTDATTQAPQHDAEDAAKEPVDKPSRKRLHVTQVAPGMWFEAQDGTVVIRGDERFCALTRGAGVVVPDGRVWFSPEPNYEVTILPNFYNEMGRLFNINPQWGYEDSPEKWPNLLAEWMKTWKYFYSRVRKILNLHYANDAQVYGRISQLIDKERVAEYRAKREEAKPVGTLRPFPLYGEEVRERAKHRDQFCADCGVLVTTDGPTLCQDCADKIAQREANRTSTDTAHLGPWTTVRACLDCGVLVTGGPTRCGYCADKNTQQKKRIDAATKLCCSPEVQAYIAYLEHMDRKKP